MKRLSVFCGSSSGHDAIFETQAYELGKSFAKQKIGLVYGGTRIGLMGKVADGVLENGGEAVGVLPHFLAQNEIAHKGLTQMIMVDNLQERKTVMNNYSDGAIALPGGFGTMEEFFEMLTWAQLHIHLKPVALLNIRNYYDPLLALLDGMVENGFLKQVNRDMLVVDGEIEQLLEKMRGYVAPKQGKWITRHE